MSPRHLQISSSADTGSGGVDELPDLVPRSRVFVDAGGEVETEAAAAPK